MNGSAVIQRPMTDDRTERLRFARNRIAEHIAERLGFGPIRTMPVGLVRRLDEEVDQAIAEWLQARIRDPDLAPHTLLQQRLAAYEAIAKGSRS